MIRPGLQRISRLMADTPMPWKAIHVGGTNGKGSVVNSISAMLKVYNDSDWRKKVGQSVLKHGQFTSPHLLDRWDGIRIQGQVISEAEFLRIEQSVDARNRRLSIDASEFEQLTATAFTSFTQSELDVAVVEVGMGGLEDATNIIGQDTDDLATFPKEYNLGDGKQTTYQDVRGFRPPPLVTAITNVSLDHTEYLGGRLQDIATHKAGIIKPGAWVAFPHGGNDPIVRRTIERTIREVDAKEASWVNLFPQLTGYPSPQKGVRNHNINIARADWLDKNPSIHFRTIPLKHRAIWRVVPRHVWRNTSVALRSVWAALTDLNLIPNKSSPYLHTIEHNFLWNMFEDMLLAPLETVVSGRQERISLAPISGSHRPVFLDGAHNGHSAKALSNAIKLLPAFQKQDKKRVTHPPIQWIVGISSTKDASTILDPLIRPDDTVHIVRFHTPIDGMPWVKPLESSEIVKVLRSRLGDAVKLVDWGQDVLGALKATGGQGVPAEGPVDPIVITGSLYLVSDVKRLLREASQEKAGSADELSDHDTP